MVGMRVSVVVCTFSSERWPLLTAALRSLEAQTRAPDEIVIVVDHNAELLERCRGLPHDPIVVPNRGLVGEPGARNAGMQACTGDIVAFIDDDAAAASDWVETLSAHFADPRVLAVGGGVQPNWLQGRPRWFPTEFDWVVGCSYRGLPRAAARVRNMIGANMAFRRDVLAGIGGFRHGLGRTGSDMSGCVETEACIRLRRAHPDAVVLYDPRAAVEHAVPPARAGLRYFLARCAAEGRAKALLASRVGRDDALASEKIYARRTLPSGIRHGFRDALGGDPAGAARAGAIVLGLITTAAGYASTMLRSRAAARDDGDG